MHYCKIVYRLVVLKYFGSVDPLTILYTLEDLLPLQHT
jgi:hypothetical protein